METWRPVPGFERTYEVSSHGGVRRLPGGRVPFGRTLALKPTPKGYFKVSLSRPGWAVHVQVHRLVYEVFVGPIPKRMTVNHKDTNKANNRVENLELLTRAENIRHGHRAGLFPRGERVAFSKLKEADVLAIREEMKTGPAETVALRHGVTVSTVCKIKNGRLWKHLPKVVEAGCRKMEDHLKPANILP